MKLGGKNEKYWLMVVLLAISIVNGRLQATKPTPKPEEKSAVLAADSTVSSMPKLGVDEYWVEKVVDGDTIKVKQGETSETVRLIGIDTPELVDKRKPVQCFAEEASKKMKATVEGKVVKLVADVSQGDKDKYGRQLRYVFLADGTNLNEEMIKEGYAFEYTYKYPYEYRSSFKAAAAEARAKDLGLWSKTGCGGKR